MADLTARQRRFVREYLIDGNATQAAIRAGYSKKTADQIGHQLLKKTSVSAAVAEGQRKVAEKLEITAEAILAELASVGFANVGDFVRVGDDGRVTLNFSKLSKADLRAVSEITQRHIGGGDGPAAVETRFKLHPKIPALVKLGENLGLFRQLHEHSGPGGGPIEVKGVETFEAAARKARAQAAKAGGKATDD